MSCDSHRGAQTSVPAWQVGILQHFSRRGIVAKSMMFEGSTFGKIGEVNIGDVNIGNVEFSDVGTFKSLKLEV